MWTLLKARFKATRERTLFIDVVNRKEVFAYRYEDREWMGQSRFGMWVETVESERWNAKEK